MFDKIPVANRGEIALRVVRACRALGELIVEGVDTTLPLFPQLLAEPDIHAGTYNIHWLEKWLDATFG